MPSAQGVAGPSDGAASARATAATPDSLWSVPEEYRPRPVSAEAGGEYFAEDGVGDPYGAGVPYPLMRAMMALWPDELGADFGAFDRRFGMIPDPEHPSDPNALPVGLHLTRDPNTGVSFLMMSCEVCHAGRVRTAAGVQVVPGLGSRTVRLQAYADALAHIASDPRFSEDRMVRAADIEAKRLGLRWPGEWRTAITARFVDSMRARFGAHRADFDRLAAGALPGRVATMEGFIMAMNAFVGTRLKLPRVTGWVRIPDVATYRYRDTNSFDAVATGSPVALVSEADFTFGVRPKWYERYRYISTSIYLYLRSFHRIFPYPAPIDHALAERGYAVFGHECTRCHGSYGEPGRPRVVSYHEKVVSISTVGTDPARLDAVTDAFVAAAARIPWTKGLVRTRRTGGYVPRPFVDVWARGQYGHNGQWPDLATVATPPDRRPRRYIVDPNAPLDLKRVGQAWRPVPKGETSPKLRPGEYLYDGTKPGFGVGGHPFLSELPEADRRAVIEYLKTL